MALFNAKMGGSAVSAVSAVICGTDADPTNITGNSSGWYAGAVIPGSYTTLTYSLPPSINHYDILYKDGTITVDSGMSSSPMDVSNIAGIYFQVSSAGTYSLTLS